jgi:high-affinity iron transporter
MFQSLVITLREGVEAALVVGIVLGYLGKTGRSRWSKVVYWALFSAVLASLLAGYFLHRLQITSDSYEGWLMLAGAVFVASMVVWMWKTGKRLKQEIEAKLSTFSETPTRSATLGLFSFVFVMVFREGMETVLFLAAVSLRTSDEMLNFMGGLIGLGLAVVLGVAFFKGSLKVDLRNFFAVTTLVLFVVAAQLLIAGVHELSEAQVLPSSQREMALVGPIVNNDAFFFVVVVALVLFLIIAQTIQARGPGAAAGTDESSPERRKMLAEVRRQRFWKAAASAVSILVIVLILTQFIYSRTAQAMSPPERVPVVDGVIRIPVAELADKKLHRYAISFGDVDVRLIAILDSSDTVRAALDACAICGSQGYVQSGNNVICRNCAAAIYVPTVGVAGGCNPIHVDYRVEGDALVIRESALAAGRPVFR